MTAEELALLDDDSKRFSLFEKQKRLDYEKCWVLHRAITMNSGEEAEAWKQKGRSWTADEVSQLLDKYYTLLLSL